MRRRPSPRAQQTDLSHVVYVMGAGRSGSTVLGVALGNCDRCFYAGELDAWLRRHGAPNFGGEERFRFWQHVRDRVGAHNLSGDAAWRLLEHSASPVRITALRLARRVKPEYESVMLRLFDAIANLADAEVIIDTSHYPLRAGRLRRLLGTRMTLIYLVRDPRAVVTSFARTDVNQPSKSFASAYIYLWVTHLLSIAVFARHPRGQRIFLRYEDFAHAPNDIIEMIGTRVPHIRPTGALGTLETGLAFQGNRLLAAPSVTLRDTGAPPYRLYTLRLVALPVILLCSRLIGRSRRRMRAAGR